MQKAMLLLLAFKILGKEPVEGGLDGAAAVNHLPRDRDASSLLIGSYISCLNTPSPKKAYEEHNFCAGPKALFSMRAL